MARYPHRDRAHTTSCSETAGGGVEEKGLLALVEEAGSLGASVVSALDGDRNYHSARNHKPCTSIKMGVKT